MKNNYRSYLDSSNARNDAPHLPSSHSEELLPQSAPPLDSGGGPGKSLWKKLLAPALGIGIIILKFGAKLKFLVLPVLKFFPILLKTGGTMILSLVLIIEKIKGSSPQPPQAAPK